MGLSESRFRQIIREEARRALHEGAGGLSILPADVPPELFSGWLRRAYRKLPQPTGDLRKRFMSVCARAGLEPRIADELTELAIACLGSGESFPFDIETAADRIVEALGYDRRRAGRVIMRLREGLAERVLGSQRAPGSYNVYEIAPSVRFLYHLSYDLIGALPRDVAALMKLERDELERGIDTMDALYAFAETKDLPKATRRKLMMMVSEGVEGALQAAEIYRMM